MAKFQDRPSEKVHTYQEKRNELKTKAVCELNMSNRLHDSDVQLSIEPQCVVNSVYRIVCA